MIKGERVTLRPATRDDRRMVYEWANNSDIAPLINLSSDASQTFEQFCDDWKEHFFTDDSPDLGRMFIILSQGSPVGTIAYNDIDSKSRVELDIWMSSEENCDRGFGLDAIEALCGYLLAEFGVKTFMMQFEKVGPKDPSYAS